MQGRDLIGRAKTGTGKTLAFGIPIINNIIRENEENRVARYILLPYLSRSKSFVSYVRGWFLHQISSQFKRFGILESSF